MLQKLKEGDTSPWSLHGSYAYDILYLFNGAKFLEGIIVLSHPLSSGEGYTTYGLCIIAFQLQIYHRLTRTRFVNLINSQVT